MDCSFPLTLSTGHNNCKKHLKGSLVLQTCSFLPPLWSSSSVSPRYSWSFTQPTLYLLSLTQRHEEPKITSFNFQFSGIIALSPGGSIFLSGTRISRLIEHKVLGTEIKKLSSVSLEVIVSGATSISALWFLDLWILAMGEAVPYLGNLIWSVYIICSLLEKFAPVLAPPSCCYVS